MEPTKEPNDPLDIEIKKYERLDKTGIILIPYLIITILIVALVVAPFVKLLALVLYLCIFIFYAAIDTHWKVLKRQKKLGKGNWEADKANRQKRIQFGTLTMVMAGVVGISWAFLILFSFNGMPNIELFILLLLIFIIAHVSTIWGYIKYNQTRKKMMSH